MPRRKPAGWPKLMSGKRLAGSVTAYYWEPPTWAKKAGCPVRAEALGTDYGAAKQRCDTVPEPAIRHLAHRRCCCGAGDAGGHVRLVGRPLQEQPAIHQEAAERRKSIDAALALTSKHKLKDGRLFGGLSLASITPGAADRLHSKLQEKPGGGTRARTALLSMQSEQRRRGAMAAARARNCASVNPASAPSTLPPCRSPMNFTSGSTPAAARISATRWRNTCSFQGR